MSNSCCSESPVEPSRARRCPRSGSAGKAVDRRTVQALLEESALKRLPPGDCYFCPDAGCEVVYFGADEVQFVTQDTRVAIWQKQPFGDRQVCYCFGESETSIRAEIEATGQSLAVGRIRDHVAAGRCACEITNPRGVCCLGDVIAAVQRVSAALANGWTTADARGTRG